MKFLLGVFWIPLFLVGFWAGLVCDALYCGWLWGYDTMEDHSK